MRLLSNMKIGVRLAAASALVEQSVAAAASWSEQARALSGVVATFRTTPQLAAEEK